jgi:hypothetical protein
MHKLLIIVCASVALLAGCSGNGNLAAAGANGSGSGSGSGTGTGTGTTTLSLGSGSGSSFQAGAIAISTTSLSAGGSTSLQVSLVDQTGALYTTATTITFSSPCQSQGLASIVATPATGTSPASPSVSTSTGTASATYVASGCNGSDVITASASANSQTLTATGTVTVQQAAIGSIAFISATPANITLKGVGSAGGSATSTLIFKVLDTSSGPRAGATVTFALNTSVGGITMSPASAVSDASGQVQTIVSGGTVATTVRVTASTVASGGATISTQSNALTVSTGIPTSANISLSVKKHNVEAWNVDGVVVPVTVRMTDRFSNPVPDGTTANFQTTLGGIDPSCQTTNGSCTVNWVSKAPRTVSGNPRTTSGNANADPSYCPGVWCSGTTNGRSPIYVTAIGEESFKDVSGSGYFNPADTVAWDATNLALNWPSGPLAGQPKPWQDTQEPFLNEYEMYDAYNNPVWVPGEPYLDFNGNGKHDGLNLGGTDFIGDGLVQSALCQGPLCSTTGSTVAIFDSNVIILSGSAAFFTPLAGTVFHYGAGSSISVSVLITDQNNQQMPAGTTVAASLASAAGTIQGPSTYTWPDSSAVGGQTFTFNCAAPTPPTLPTAGSLIVTVTTPGGIVTTQFYTVAP